MKGKYLNSRRANQLAGGVAILLAIFLLSAPTLSMLAVLSDEGEAYACLDYIGENEESKETKESENKEGKNNMEEFALLADLGMSIFHKTGSHAFADDNLGSYTFSQDVLTPPPNF